MEHFEISDKNGIRTVKFNNERKKNALNKGAYYAVAEILNDAAQDDTVKCVVLTGKGDFYSSGNDLTQEIQPPPEGVSPQQPMITMVQAYIRFPKLLIALVNGPAIGIAATTVALCDIIYASESAYFYSPFTNLGLCAEGCSSVTFPRILGTSKANEMLMLNHKLSAQEALTFGFVAHVYKDEQEVWKKLEQIKDLPLGSIIANKKLQRKFTIDELELANLAEAQELSLRFYSDEAINAMINFQSRRKSKL